MKLVQLTVGLTIAVGLLVAAVLLTVHGLLIVGAPVGALAVGVGWATVDNTLVYPAERARRAAARGEAVENIGDAANADAADTAEITAHQSPS